MIRELAPLTRLVVVLVALLAFGTAGFMIVDGLSLLEAAYMTVTTVSTVGYGEIRPLSWPGRVFAMVLIIVGVGVALYTLTEVVRYVYEGQLGHTFWRRRMQRQVNSLHDHFILCGYGRVGRQIADDLSRAGIPFVVVDTEPVGLELASERGLTIVEGDAGSDEVLRNAGVERARGLISAVAEDTDNIYVVLSARALNPELLIVVRANTEEAIPKLERAGANRVVSPYAMGGRRMSMLALRPLSVEFIDAAFHGERSEVLLEDVAVRQGSALIDKTVEELQTSLAPGVSILALKRNLQILPRPDGSASLEAGDEMVIMGTSEQLQQVERLA